MNIEFDIETDDDETAQRELRIGHDLSLLSDDEMRAYVEQLGFGTSANAAAVACESMRRFRRAVEKQTKSYVDRLKEQERVLEDRLRLVLTDGEMADAQNGRVAFRSQVAGGNATVRVDVIKQHHEQLKPLGIGMREKPPSVTELRRHKRELQSLGLRLRDVLLFPERVDGIKWQKLGDEDE